MLTVRAVESRRDLERFIRFAYRVYRDDPNWVAPLLGDLRHALTPGRHPFWSHAERALFLAERDGRVVGRVAAIDDRNYNAFHDSSIGFFGFFETENDQEVVDALFDAVYGFCREHGLATVYGPANPSMNDESGMLLGPHDMPPYVKMSYNPPWYPALVEAAGFTKVKDQLAFVARDQPMPAKIERVVRMYRDQPGIEMRRVDMAHLERDLGYVKEIYNDAWSRNWDFAPMTDEEIDELARQVKPILKPELCPIVFYRGEPAGIAVGLPDYNQALIGLRGHLYPFGWLKFLLARRRIDRARVWALGIRRKFHGLGLGSLLYHQSVVGARQLGYREAEMSWILEDNEAMIRPLMLFDARVHKTYRVYQHPVPAA